MVPRVIALVAIVMLCCSGCLNSGDGNRVNQLLTKQKENADKLSEMSSKINTVDRRLTGIQEKVDALAGTDSGTSSGKGPDLVVASDFASTPEYKGILQMMDALKEQVARVQGDFAGFQDQLTAARELEALRDRGAAFEAMSQPGEMSQRLDILVKNFSGNIADAATRAQFVQDVESLKASFFASLSPEEKLQRARALLSEAMNSAGDNDRMRGMLERQLQSLDQADNPEELNERVDRMLQFQKVREIGELTQKYNIPEETVRNSGIVSFGGRMRGFFPGGGGGPGGRGAAGGRGAPGGRGGPGGR